MSKNIKIFGKNIKLYTTVELIQIQKAQARGIQDMLGEQELIAEELTRRFSNGDD